MKEEIHKELQELSPLLAKLPKNGHNAAPPEGYFDGFEDRLLERLGEEQPTANKPKLTAVRTWTIGVGVAASLLLIAGVFWFYNTTTSVQDQAVLAGNLDDHEVESYILENITEFEAENLSRFVELQENELWEDAPDDLLDELSIEELEELL